MQWYNTENFRYNTDVRETGIKETLDKMYSETDCIKFMEDIFSKVYRRKLKMTAAPEKTW